jgi:hypothetical protein
MTALIILEIILLVAGVLAVRNLLLKLESAEENIEKLTEIISQYNKFWVGLKNAIDVADVRLRQIDEKETFKSDDEIGWFFENIKAIQGNLNVFFTEQIKTSQVKDKK